MGINCRYIENVLMLFTYALLLFKYRYLGNAPSRNILNEVNQSEIDPECDVIRNARTLSTC